MGFLVSPRFDVAFFIASLGVPLLLWAGFAAGWLTGVAVYVIFQLAFNLPHNFQTWTLTALDPVDRARDGRRDLVALAVIVALFGGAMVLSPDGVYPWLRDGLIYWGYYHLVRQHYGFLALYQRKAGGAIPRWEQRLYPRLLDAICYLPLVVRWRDPSLMTIHAGGLDTWVRHPIVPPAVWIAALALFGAAVLFVVAHHVALLRRGGRVVLPRLLLFVSITIAFGLADLVAGDLIVAIAIVTAYHNLQYIGLVWFRTETRARLGLVDGNPFVAWLRDGRWLRYAACALAYGVVIFAPRALLRGVRLGELPLTAVVALHYVVDARLWKGQRQPRLAVELGLRPPSPSPSPPPAEAPRREAAA
jgi:hypothetical protein